MQVMIQLREDTARELQAKPLRSAATTSGESDAKKLLEVLDGLGVELVPVHPGQTHPLLVGYFMVQVPDQKTADQVIHRLKEFDSVEGAYLKPGAEPP